MAENEYFKRALSDFAFDMAGGGAIRHLTDKGYTVKQILGELDFAVPVEKVRQMVWDRLVEQRVLLLEEPGMETVQGKVVFVEEKGRFGKSSFRRVVIPEEGAGQAQWEKMRFTVAQIGDFRRILNEKCMGDGKRRAYVSCDFGILEREDAGRYLEMMERLEERQREYVEGLPWIRQRVYHQVDARMREISERLVSMGFYEADVYIAD